MLFRNSVTDTEESMHTLPDCMICWLGVYMYLKYIQTTKYYFFDFAELWPSPS